MGNFSLAHNRIRVLVLFLAIVMFMFGLRLVQVQALQAGDYRSRAVNEMEKVKTLQAPRGDITDINGVPFARSVAATSIVVDQTQISNPAKVAAFVAPIIGMKVQDVQEALTGTRKWNMVAENAKPATWLKLSDALDQYNSRFKAMSPDRIIGFFSSLYPLLGTLAVRRRPRISCA